MSHNWCHTLRVSSFHSRSISVRGIQSVLAPMVSLGISQSRDLLSTATFNQLACEQRSFLRGTRPERSKCPDVKGARVCSLAAELTAWLAAKWPTGELLKYYACDVIPLASGYPPPLANSHSKRRWVSAGPVESVQWLKQHSQVCLQKRPVHEEHGREADGQRSSAILVDCPSDSDEISETEASQTTSPTKQ